MPAQTCQQNAVYLHLIGLRATKPQNTQTYHWIASIINLSYVLILIDVHIFVK